MAKHAKTMNLKYQLQHGTKNLNCQMDHILYQIFKFILSISSKKHETVINNAPIKIYVNKIENEITLLIKSRYYLECFYKG